MMIRRIIVAASLACMTSACTVPLKELRHSGGYPGYLMDKRLFRADESKQLQLLRMTMIVALASRVGNATIRDGKESDAFVSYLQNASSELNYLAGHLYGAQDEKGNRYTCNDLTNPIAIVTATGKIPPPFGGQCETYAALFESDLPQLEYKVMRLVLAALPQRQAAELARATTSGDMVASAWRLLRLAAAAADGLHRGAAVYRSSQEILALTITTQNGICAEKPKTPDIRTVESAVQCLGLSLAELGNNPNENHVKFPTEITYAPFEALFEITRTSCGMLPVETGLADDAEKPITARRGACANLRFRPALRFGGRTGWDKMAEQQSAQTPGGPITVTDEGGGPPPD